jgi:hypothetical protein
VAAVMTCLAGSATAQDIPRTPDGKPDFSGIWEQPRKVNTTGPTGGPAGRNFDEYKMSPFQPGGEALLYQQNTGDVRVDEPRALCMPAGFPAGMTQFNPIQIFQTPKYFVLVHEFQRMTRIIPLDGRPHRQGIEPTYYGDSVGRWEGDTLVIESKNFKRWLLDDHHYTNRTRSRWHTDALRTVEHLTLKNRSTISYRITIDDPKIFTAPWSQDFELTAKPEWEALGLLEYVCQENNRCAGGTCSAP